ncbi:MAG: prolyl oligopeptidase family serine peptidase [Rhodothermaceae bacterium]|nr:prolyl oligopeptidase family serine peptidase [Rhodothermaceae bacterium]
MKSNSVKKDSGTIPSSEGLPIAYDLYTPSHAMYELPVVLFLHGFKGFKDWGTFPDACIEMASTGYAVLAMNFSLNGTGDNPCEFDRLDLFARETLSQDLEDVASVLEALKDSTIKSSLVTMDPHNVSVIGHSRGGHTAVVAASELDQITMVVTWAAVSNVLKQWSEAQINDWKTKGYTEILNSRTGQTMRVDRVVYDEDLNLPCCFIHGTDDDAVSFEHTQILYENCPSSEKDRIFIDGANHTFGSTHPYLDDNLPKKFTEVLDHTIRWLDSFNG